jgi:putative membrane protein
MDDTASKFDTKPSVSNHFDWMRTQMAMQQTLMSATRTAIALIGFGFTVAQFFEKLQGKVPLAEQLSPEAPRNVGIGLIAGGLITLGVFVWQYQVAERYIRSEPFADLAVERRLHSASYFAALVVLLIGVIALLSVLLRF